MIFNQKILIFYINLKMYPDFQSRIENQLSKLNIKKVIYYKEKEISFIKKFLSKWDLNHLCKLIVNNNYFENYNDLWFLKDSLNKNSIDYDKKLDEQLNNNHLSKKKLLWLLDSVCNNNKPEQKLVFDFELYLK
jgi:hypothetical protein